MSSSATPAALAVGLGAKIEDVLAVDLVGAQNAGLELAGEPLSRLLDGGHWVERDVERGRPPGVETAAVNGRALAGLGLNDQRGSWARQARP